MSGNRDNTPYRFDLLIPDFLRLMAKAMGEGHLKYDDERMYPNWQYGLEGDRSPINHAFDHLTAYHELLDAENSYAEVDILAEHLAHLACNAMMEYWLLVNGSREPDLEQIPDMEPVAPPPIPAPKTLLDKLKERLGELPDALNPSS